MSLVNLMASGGARFALDFAYNGYSENITPQSTYTFSSKSIGKPNANRWVVVGIAISGLSDSSAAQVTIGGVACTEIGFNSFFTGGGPGAIAYAKVPSGSTADIVISGVANGQACGIAVYSFNTRATARLDGVTAFTGATNTNNYSLNNVQCTTGGVVIYAHATFAGPLTATWNGIDTAVEDVDTTIDTSRMAAGHVLTTENATGRDLALTLPSTRGEAAAVSFAFIT